LVAGGIVPITGRDQRFRRTGVELAALAGGGLFKNRASAAETRQPGTWAVLLVHPDGIISTTNAGAEWLG